MALRAAGFVIIQSATPGEDPITTGYLWADTGTQKLKQCTGVGPYVWTEIGPFNGSTVKLDALAAPDDITTLNASTTAHGLMPKRTGLAVDIYRGDGTQTPQALSNTNGLNPTGTTNTAAYVMMGIGALFTPLSTGRFVCIVSANGMSTAIGSGGSFSIVFGTGSAPTNGAALTGTPTGGTRDYTVATVANRFGVTAVALETTLSKGTQYWFDVALKALVSGTASLKDVSITILEY